MKAADIRRSSKDALKMIYYVIIGLAITEALSHTFRVKGSFIGWQVFDRDNLSTTLLLIALVPTICRFVHGASILSWFSEIMTLWLHEIRWNFDYNI